MKEEEEIRDKRREEMEAAKEGEEGHDALCKGGRRRR